MRIGIIGINHKWADLQLREQLAQACQRCFIGSGSSCGQHTFVLLTTCNRTEIYFSSEDLTETHSYLLQMLRNEVREEFDQRVYSYFGQDCFLHLSRVTAGLDSAILAETEIQGQVKAAYEQAAGQTKLPGEMHFLFQKALKIGKQVRSELQLGRGMPDLEHAVFNTGRHFFTKTEQSKVLFVGASDVNCKILAFLKSKKINKIAICNRSLNKAQDVAQTYQIPILEWQKLSQWHEYDWIIFGTKSPHPLIHKNELPDFCSRKLVIDLSVPRNVDPKLGQDKRIALLNIDQINRILRARKFQLVKQVQQAEQLISTSIMQQMQIYGSKRMENKRQRH